MNSYILEYYAAIQSGEEVVGDEIKQLYRRLVLEASDPIYQNRNGLKFVQEDAEKRIRFIEKHCKHSEAPNAGKPFILALFQRAIVEAIHAIKQWSDELQRYIRKYQEILYLVGRKNGKTPFIGALALAEWFCGPMGMKILCASNDYEQADLLYSAINAMREESPALEKRTHTTVKGIFFGNKKHRTAKGKFSYQNKGSIKKLSKRQKNKEGRNIAMGCVDEVFEMEDDSLTMPIRQALSTQDEPLYFEMTTEGFLDDGYLAKRVEYARKVNAGEIEDDKLLAILYTQDSEREVFEDEQSWKKANPGLGLIKKVSFLRGMVEEARHRASTKAFVLAKDFNIRQNQAAAWLTDEEIGALQEYEMEDLRGCVAIGGADLSETGDLTNAKAMIVNPVTKKKYVVSHYFVPETKLEWKTDEERIRAERYKEWAKAGYLTLCEGEEVNHTYVVEFFLMLWKRYRIKVIYCGYDKWQARGFRNDMQDMFEMEKIEQGFSLSNAMEMIEGDLRAGRIAMNNPIDLYCLKNTATVWNASATKRMPAKAQGDKEAKIDGAVVLLICYETLSRHRGDFMRYAEQKNVGGENLGII